MDNASPLLRKRLEAMLADWQKNGRPARATLHETADALLQWKEENAVTGLWDTPPRMLGATLDDGWGHGIQLILKYARVMGIETAFAGVLQTWEQIVDACEAYEADYLGLTVLQFDTEEDLIKLRNRLPERIRIIAGGPVFQIDPELQARVGIEHVTRDAAGFLRLWMTEHQRPVISGSAKRVKD